MVAAPEQASSVDDLSAALGLAEQMKAAFAVAPTGVAVVFNRSDFSLVDSVEVALGDLPWALDTQHERRGLSLFDLIDATYHEPLRATIDRATSIGVGRTSAQLAGGAVNQVTLVCFGPRTDQAIAVFDGDGYSVDLIVDKGSERARLICDLNGTLLSTDVADPNHPALGAQSGEWAHQLVHEVDRPAYLEAIASVVRGEPYARVLVKGRTNDLAFEIVVVSQGATLVIDFFDRSLRNQTLSALQRSQTQFNQLSETLPVGVFVVGTGGRMTFTSDRLRDMLAPIVASEWDWVNVVHEQDRHLLETAVTDLPSIHQFSIELRCYRLDGTVGWFRLAGSDMRDPDGLLKCVVGFVEDIEERRELQQRIEHQASFDSLTGLPNRITIVDELTQRLGSEHADRSLTAVLFVDLDGFKLINDSQGHSVGDSVLIEVARRFRRSVRPRDLIGRFGGDEFVVVASDLADENDAMGLARRLHDVLETRVRAEGRIINVNTSIGIALADSDGATSEELIGNADIAMYEAKAAGRNQTSLFDATLRARASKRFNMTADLRHARRRCELRLDYQPIIELDSGSIVGAEALVRWEHPTMGCIGPDVFVPLAEEIGLISDVGEWVVSQACTDLDRLLAASSVDPSFVMSINASTHQFNDVASLATSSLASLEHFGLHPRQLRFELTESVPITQIPAAASRIKQLTSYGFGLAIDDFGTGYSSLGYLTMLPFDVLKLDLSLIAQVAPHSPALAVVRSLTRMARDIGFSIVAEGIETEMQLELLNDIGVLFGQGFHISRPITIDQLETLGSTGQECLG